MCDPEVHLRLVVGIVLLTGVIAALGIALLVVVRDNRRADRRLARELYPPNLERRREPMPPAAEPAP